MFLEMVRLNGMQLTREMGCGEMDGSCRCSREYFSHVAQWNFLWMERGRITDSMEKIQPEFLLDQ